MASATETMKQQPNRPKIDRPTFETRWSALWKNARRKCNFFQIMDLEMVETLKTHIVNETLYNCYESCKCCMSCKKDVVHLDRIQSTWKSFRIFILEEMKLWIEYLSLPIKLVWAIKQWKEMYLNRCGKV